MGGQIRERCLVVGRQADWRLGLSELICPEEPVWAVTALPNHKGFFMLLLNAFKCFLNGFESIQMQLLNKKRKSYLGSKESVREKHVFLFFNLPGLSCCATLLVAKVANAM